MGAECQTHQPGSVTGWPETFGLFPCPLGVFVCKEGQEELGEVPWMLEWLVQRRCPQQAATDQPSGVHSTEGRGPEGDGAGGETGTNEGRGSSGFPVKLASCPCAPSSVPAGKTSLAEGGAQGGGH